MGDIKNLSSTAIYAWTTLISVLICVPGALIFEGPKLQAGIDVALQKEPKFYLSLLSVGLLYHLYNQVSTPGMRGSTTIHHASTAVTSCLQDCDQQLCVTCCRHLPLARALPLQ